VGLGQGQGLYRVETGTAKSAGLHLMPVGGVSSGGQPDAMRRWIAMRRGADKVWIIGWLGGTAQRVDMAPAFALPSATHVTRRFTRRAGWASAGDRPAGADEHLQRGAGLLSAAQQDRQVAQEHAAVARHHLTLAGREPQLVDLQREYDTFSTGSAAQGVVFVRTSTHQDTLRLSGAKCSCRRQQKGTSLWCSRPRVRAAVRAS